MKIFKIILITMIAIVAWLFIYGNLSGAVLGNCIHGNIKTNLLFIYRAKKTVSYNGEARKYEKIPGVYPWNFTCIYDNYSKDNKIIYYLGYPLAWSDYETFKAIPWSPYAQDKKNVYCRGKIMDGADPDSFALGATSEQRDWWRHPSHDKNRWYSCDFEM